MKFVAISLPAIPASPEERQQLRPIGHRTDKWQQMIEENVTLAQMLDDYGWEAYTFPEHQLHTEGFEIGFSSALGMHILNNRWPPVRGMRRISTIARCSRKSIGSSSCVGRTRPSPMRASSIKSPRPTPGARGLPWR